MSTRLAALSHELHMPFVLPATATDVHSVIQGTQIKVALDGHAGQDAPEWTRYSPALVVIKVVNRGTDYSKDIAFVTVEALPAISSWGECLTPKTYTITEGRRSVVVL